MFYVIDICEVKLECHFILSILVFEKPVYTFGTTRMFIVIFSVVCVNTTWCNSTLLCCSQFIRPHNVFELGIWINLQRRIIDDVYVYAINMHIAISLKNKTNRKSHDRKVKYRRCTKNVLSLYITTDLLSARCVRGGM